MNARCCIACGRRGNRAFRAAVESDGYGAGWICVNGRACRHRKVWRVAGAEMRVLTVRQPWAHAIAHLGKDVENRTWSTKYRGAVAILSGRTFDVDARARVELLGGRSLADPLVGGLVVALVDLVDVHLPGDCWVPAGVEVDGGRYCSPWAEAGTYHWVLGNVRPVREGPGLVGALGLRRLPPDYQRDVLERVVS